MSNYAVGNFQLNTSTGAQSVTGVGFQPKGILFFVTPYTVSIDDADFSNNVYQGMGMADGTSQYATHCSKPDTDSGLGTASFAQTQSYCILGGVNASSMYYASLTSFDSDGFTINIQAAPGVGYWVGYMAWGGALVTGVKAGTFNGSTGTQTVSGVGFTPTGLIAITLGSTANFYTSGNSTTGSSYPCVGVSDGANSFCVSGWLRSDGITTKVSAGAHSNTKFLQIIAADTSPPPSFSGSGTITAFGSGSFTITWTTNPGAIKCMYLAIAGPTFTVGAFGLPTSTGAFTAVTGLSFQPEAVLLLTGGQTAYNNIQGAAQSANLIGYESSFSMSTGPEANKTFTIGNWSKDYTSTAEERSFSHSTHAVRLANLSNTPNEEAAITSLDATGFSMTSTYALGSGTSKVGYMAMSIIYDPGGGNSGSGSGTADSPDASFMFGWVGV